MKDKLFYESKINNLMNDTLSKLRSLVDSTTVVGEPMPMPDGTVIIPVSKAVIGFVLGGGEYYTNDKKRLSAPFPMAGGSGGGANVMPIGFLVVHDKTVEFVNVSKPSIEFEKIYSLMKKGVEALKKKAEENEKK